MARGFTGARLVPAMGNVQHCTTYTLGWLPPGHYTWQVQAVDSGLVASEWPPPPAPPDVDADFVCGANFAELTPVWLVEEPGGGQPGPGPGSAGCVPARAGSSQRAALLAGLLALAAAASRARVSRRGRDDGSVRLPVRAPRTQTGTSRRGPR